jgi:N utilization substance protein B
MTNASNSKQEKARAGSRHKARTVALQTLYEVTASGHDAEQVLDRVTGEIKLNEENAGFAKMLVYGVLDNEKKIDQYIQRFAPQWPVEQLSIIDHTILRLAIFEILLDNKVPIKVAINEAVELAKVYGSDNSARFINGVLGAVSQLPETKEQRG